MENRTMAAIYLSILAVGLIFLLFKCKGGVRRMCRRRRNRKRNKERTYYYLKKG